jgi:hypothetical protein
MPPMNNLSSFYKEIIIGFELNKLNNPGFVKTIGYYDDNICKIPLNPEKHGCTYLYLEKVEGPTMNKFIKTASPLQFKIVISKLLRNYEIALNKYKFTHYDLHPDNVIVSAIKGELMPVFIDFGLSHISLKDGDLGESSDFYEEEGIYPGQTNWIHDFFKLLGFCWLATNEKYAKQLSQNRYNSAKAELEENVSGGYFISYGYIYNEETEEETEIEETPFEFADRGIAKGTGMRNEDEEARIKNIILKMKEDLVDAENNIQLTKNLFKANGFNMKLINKHCLKLLNYFYSDVSDEWLFDYYENFNMYFSSWRTDEGKLSNFSDFIKFCDSFIGF